MAKVVVVRIGVKDQMAGSFLEEIGELIAYGGLGDCVLLKSEIKNLNSKDISSLTYEQMEALDVPTHIE